MIEGNDRSHLNSPYALAKLYAQGKRFCFFKATQALTFIDPTFNTSWQEAKAVPDFFRGAYHFFDPRFDGTAQAKHYLSLGIDFSKPYCLRPWVDVEDLTGDTPEETAQLNQWVADNWQLALQLLNDFLDYVKEQTGFDCGIYSYNNYMREYYHNAPFPNNPFWLSSLQPACPVRYDTGELPEFWQDSYTDNGTDMDGDFFTGTQQQLNQLANIT